MVPFRSSPLVALLIPTVLCFSATPGTAQVAPGLVAAYSFSEGAGISAGDSSGNNNSGTIRAATWTTGRFGGALAFDGVNSWVTIDDADSLDLTTGMTLEAWVYPTGTATGWTTVLMKEQPGGMVYSLLPGSPENLPMVYISTASSQGVAGSTALPFDTWSHLAATYDGTTLMLYVNGAQVGSSAIPGGIRASAGMLRIGGNSIWGEYFQGRIDELRIYNRPLSQIDIQSDMNTSIGETPSPTLPSQVGQWSGPFAWPVVAVHMSLLRTGEVLIGDGQSNGRDVRLWNPTTTAFTDIPGPYSNIFCSGHAALPDGRILVVGGHVAAHSGIADVNVFDPATQNWALGAPMAVSRWYPTATALPDGRVLVTAGEIDCRSCNAEIPEIYDPMTNTWTQLTAARLNILWYPHMFVLPDGRVLAAGSNEGPIVTRTLDPHTHTWTTVDPVEINGGSSAMYLPGKVITSGFGRAADSPIAPSVPDTLVLDMTQPSPAWRQTASMAFPRVEHNLTLLPDGTVLATGGGRNTDVFDLASAVREAELWSPATETWTTMARMQVPRLYHSTALLLPDGRVLLAGGGRYGVNQFSAEIYSPPYLFRGNRPTITSAPIAIQYGASFSLETPDASRIAAVSLLRPGSVTHAFNQDQRFVPLTFEQVGGELNVQAPPNANLAPPGFYMLFILDTNGVPSLASFLRLSLPEDGSPPTAPGSLTATGSIGAVSLTWSASSDNVRVAGYNVHRSTSAGILPTPANKIAQTTSTGYTDSGLASGTYFYVVTAEDAARNVGPPSNEASGTATADTAEPTAPSNLTATAVNSTQIDLAWTASTDNVAVTLYEVERCQGIGCSNFVQVGRATGTTYSDTGLSLLTQYTFRVRARDAAGNAGPYSNRATAMTPLFD